MYNKAHPHCMQVLEDALKVRWDDKWGKGTPQAMAKTLKAAW
jgi:hypothetical protein